jgi:hypothetical protein
MAQWFAQLVFKGDTLLGEGLTDFALVEGVASPSGGWLNKARELEGQP